MSNVVRIEKELFEEAQKIAKVESRTPALQIAYWAKIGKATLDNPDLPVEFIRDVMLARADKDNAENFEFKR